MENQKKVSYDNFKALKDLNCQLQNKIDKLQGEKKKLAEMVEILKKFNYLGDLIYDIRNLRNKRHS